MDHERGKRGETTELFELGVQPLMSDWLIPYPNPDGRIIEQAAQPASGTEQPGPARNPVRDSAQVNRAALVNTNVNSVR